MHTTHGAVNMSNHTVAVGKDEKISQSTFKILESGRVGNWGNELVGPLLVHHHHHHPAPIKIPHSNEFLVARARK